MALCVVRASASLSTASPQALANLMWSLATWCPRDCGPALDVLASAAMAQMRRMGPQDLSMLVWAFATLEQLPLPPANGLIDTAPRHNDATRPSAGQFWSNGFLISLARRARRLLHDRGPDCFTPQGLANMVWGLGKLAGLEVPSRAADNPGDTLTNDGLHQEWTAQTAQVSDDGASSLRSSSHIKGQSVSIAGVGGDDEDRGEVLFNLVADFCLAALGEWPPLDSHVKGLVGLSSWQQQQHRTSAFYRFKPQEISSLLLGLAALKGQTRGAQREVWRVRGGPEAQRLASAAAQWAATQNLGAWPTQVGP